MLPVDIRELSLKCDKARIAMTKVGVRLPDEAVENGDILNRTLNHETAFSYAVQQQEAELKAARDAYKARQAKAQEIKQQITEARARKKDLESQLNVLKESKSVSQSERALITRKEQLQVSLRELDDKIEAAQVAAAKGGSLKLDELTTQVVMFSERLGLGAHKLKEGWIRIEFRYINPDDPEQCFSFAVRADDDAYEISDVNPYVDDIEPLVRKLNTEPHAIGFANFCKNMRKKFREPYLNLGY